MEQQTSETIQEIITIGVEYGVDIVGAVVLLVIGWTIASWARRGVRRALDACPGWTIP